MPRRTLVVFLPLLLVAATASYKFGPSARSLVANSPAPGTMFLYPERIALDDGGFVTADRGMVFVPVNRNKPTTSVIGIEIYRFRGTGSGARERYPVFLLNGGPGFAGLEQPLRQKGFYERRVKPLTEIADLVVVGQRGIGSSKPNTICEPAESFPLDRDVSDEQSVAAVQSASAKCRSYWESEGLDLSGFTVVEAAADVDDVREALGYEKIVIWGGSFGSHWGMAVMRFHPEIVAHALLNGMEGPDHTYDMPSWVLNSVMRMANAAEQSDELRDLIPEGGLVEALKTVIARVEQEPVEVRVTNPRTRKEETVRFDAGDVRGMALGYTRRMSSRGGMPTWPSDILTLHSGDFSKAAEARMRNRVGGGGLRTASYFMLDCGSGISHDREVTLNADSANTIVGQLGWWYQSNCPVWESDLGEDFRANFTTGIPTVIVHGTWDVSTPFENAVELAPFFTNSRFVRVIGGSHGALGEAIEESDEFREALWHYAKTGDSSRFPDEVKLPPIEWVVPRLDTGAND